MLLLSASQKICVVTTILNKNFWKKNLIAYETDRIENDASNNSFTVTDICYRGNVFTRPLPSNNLAIHIQTKRLMGRIYVARR
jgi:hypothetical protein